MVWRTGEQRVKQVIVQLSQGRNDLCLTRSILLLVRGQSWGDLKDEAERVRTFPNAIIPY